MAIAFSRRFLPATIKGHMVKIVITRSISPDENSKSVTLDWSIKPTNNLEMNRTQSESFDVGKEQFSLSTPTKRSNAQHLVEY